MKYIVTHQWKISKLDKIMAWLPILSTRLFHTPISELYWCFGICWFWTTWWDEKLSHINLYNLFKFRHPTSCQLICIFGSLRIRDLFPAWQRKTYFCKKSLQKWALIWFCFYENPDRRRSPLFKINRKRQEDEIMPVGENSLHALLSGFRVPEQVTAELQRFKGIRQFRQIKVHLRSLG